MASEYQDISVERLREYMGRHHEQDYLLVDVRQPDEYSKGHLPGSVLIPLGELPERMLELPVDKDIVFYCRSGKRSRGAAVLTGSRPYVAGTVFNLAGGILAWDGQVLLETPSLKTFDLSGTDRDVLLQAMNLERGAERFYLALRQRYGAVAWTNSLASLADAEEAHARMIYRFWAADQADPPSFATVYATLAGDIIEGGHSSAVLVAMLEELPLTPCRATMEMVLVVEYAAYDLCRNLAHRFQGQPLAQVFNAIAEMEKEHIQLAAKGLALCDA